MIVRKATIEDIPRILEVCEQAKAIMRSDGNLQQWTDGYPSEEVIRKDIANSHNVADTCFSYCWGCIQNLRIDTHRDNRIMRHCIEKTGFKYCGIIYLENGDERLAFQKI